MQGGDTNRPPYWFVAIVVVMVLPLLAYPFLWEYVDNNSIIGLDYDMFKVLIALLPIYVILSAWLSCKIYMDRPSVAWMLLALLLMCYMACGWLFAV